MTRARKRRRPRPRRPRLPTRRTTKKELPDFNSNEPVVSIDFTDTDIKEVVKIMSELTGQNFMIDKNVAGTVTIISPTKVTPREAYDIFMSVLAVNGLTTVKVGKITKIIPIKDAQGQPIETHVGGLGRPNDQFVTQLMPLEHIDANDVATAFASLVSADGNIFAYGPSNMVIVMDTASNIQRIIRILRRLDVAGGEQKVEVIPLEYADAEQMADVILELFEGEGGGGGGGNVQDLRARLAQQRRRLAASRRGGGRAAAAAAAMGSSVPSKEETKIIADARTNSLIIKSTPPGIRQIRAVIDKLDTPLPWGEGKIHVVYLENANAEELAMTLADLAGTGGGGAGGIRSPQQQGLGGDQRNMARNIAGQLSGRSSTGLGSGGIDRTGSSGLASTTGRFLADFDGAVRITAEPSTNSLVIIASYRDYQILEEVIHKLDIPRRQVFVEALIMEITMDRGLDVGFEFRSTNDVTEEGVQVIGGTNYGGIQQAAANPLGISGFAIGAADGTITFAGETFPNIGALFRALATDQDVNVLSTPHVLTLDNEEAEVVVANNVPFVTGQIFSAANNLPTTTIERQDVGITLRLTPQINESDFVKLLIYQEVSQVTDSPEGISAESVGVTTAKRSADTVVVVKDRQTVIIGGLLKDSVSVVDSKVPILGDIPLLGYLFKNSKKKVEKTNLLIFLTPYVIKDASDLEDVTRRSNKRMEMFREVNHIPERVNDLGTLDERNMTPRDTIFREPMGEVIETDPRLRRQLEEERRRRKAGDDGLYFPEDEPPASEEEEESSPPEESDDTGSGDDFQPIEDE
ncbi:MAG: type II secretion system secretin GspD [Deltaproteobacteria bacterium]|nr:type II secretion system secretin GspD [Deltaproteobacteria bacterium]